jgi:MoaA/NifB/PqqE/SkfB family radical SAM enzyme
MPAKETKTSNITGISAASIFAEFFWHALLLMLSEENRDVRSRKGVSAGDAFFNFIKLSLFQYTMLKYRYMVSFNDKVIIDSTFPPYPSPAFDKRLSNYLNNLDLTELPSGIISVSTTNCCPYSCSFCSTSAHRDPEADLDEELLKTTIRQIEALGVPTIILHGGEPLYRYDRFLRLVKHVNKDMCIWMFTTGYAATLEKAVELRENGLFGVWVSLDHYDPKVHNRLRGHSQAFENAIKGIEVFKKAGVYTCLSLVPPDDLLEPENFLKYYDLARDLGVAEIRILERKPCGREACKGVIPHSPVLEQLQKDLFWDRAYRHYPPISGLSTWLEKDPAFGCQCRFEYLFITSTGEVQPCEASEISFGNITKKEFPEVYQRICKAFPRPATGCIPMVMFPEVRNYQIIKDQLSSEATAELSAQIMKSFQEKGKIPGAYKRIWSIYQRRLQVYRNRKTVLPASHVNVTPN